MPTARVFFRVGVEHRLGVREEEEEGEEDKRMLGGGVLTASMTPDLSYGVSMTFLMAVRQLLSGRHGRGLVR
jgi:hypothetical protein